MQLDDLSDFFLVASHGGFAETSRVSGRPKASLSRKVIALEDALGQRLFDRSGRTVRLTEEGAHLFQRIQGPLRDLTEAEADLRNRSSRPQGLLRISAPVLFGQMRLGRIAAEFARVCPEVRLSIDLDDREVDPVTDGYDLVIRVNPRPGSDLVGRCFARDSVLLVSTPGLRATFEAQPDQDRAPLPVILRDKARTDTTWQLSGAGSPQIKVAPVLDLPHLAMIRDAVLSGIGAARLPRLIVADDLASGRLVSWGVPEGGQAELWALYPSRRLPGARLRAFTDFLVAAHGMTDQDSGAQPDRPGLPGPNAAPA